MSEFVKIPAVMMRGGTSKGAYLMLDDLPKDEKLRDKVILSIYGSPDNRQISGIGGGDPLTSKVALIKRSGQEDIDVEYTFGYVGINDSRIDYDGNCGNISAGVGPYAIQKGLVEAVEPVTCVRILNTNTKKVIEAEVPVCNGEVVSDGDFSIAGVPGTGARITLNFINSGGSKTGRLLPTGNVVDEITMPDGQKVRISIVDAANPSVFVKAQDIGMSGLELPEEAVANPSIIEKMDYIRRLAGVMMGLAKAVDMVGQAVPKVAVVSAPQDYLNAEGEVVKEEETDLVARTLALGVMHKAYAVTGGICVATAAMIDGTVVSEVTRKTAKNSGNVHIGHPSGVLDVEVNVGRNTDGNWNLSKAAISRTARPIMEGNVYVPRRVFEGCQ